MNDPEFPPELVERCAKSVRRRQNQRTMNNRDIFDEDVPATEGELDNAAAILRESGYADLVAMLKAARRHLYALREARRHVHTLMSGPNLTKINAALKKVGEI